MSLVDSDASSPSIRLIIIIKWFQTDEAITVRSVQVRAFSARNFPVVESGNRDQ